MLPHVAIAHVQPRWAGKECPPQTTNLPILGGWISPTQKQLKKVGETGEAGLLPGTSCSRVGRSWKSFGCTGLTAR